MVCSCRDGSAKSMLSVDRIVFDDPLTTTLSGPFGGRFKSIDKSFSFVPSFNRTKVKTVKVQEIAERTRISLSALRDKCRLPAMSAS